MKAMKFSSDGRNGGREAKYEVPVFFRLDSADTDFRSRIAVISAAKKMNPQRQFAGDIPADQKLTGRQRKIRCENRTSGGNPEFSIPAVRFSPHRQHLTPAGPGKIHSQMNQLHGAENQRKAHRGQSKKQFFHHRGSSIISFSISSALSEGTCPSAKRQFIIRA